VTQLPTANKAKSAKETVISDCESFTNEDGIAKCLYVHNFISTYIANKANGLVFK
jgi:hypothetical protein